MEMKTVWVMVEDGRDGVSFVWVYGSKEAALKGFAEELGHCREDYEYLEEDDEENGLEVDEGEMIADCVDFRIVCTEQVVLN